jgi:LemA protein
MKRTWIILAAVVGAIVLTVIIFFSWAGGVFDKAVRYQEDAKKSWGNVQTANQRRADLVPQLVATVQAGAENENKILTEVTQARAGIVNAETPEQMEVMGKKINTAINLAFEAYPQIRSTENFGALQSQLEGSENRISEARVEYNSSVSTYNTHIRGFFKRWALNLVGSADEFPPKTSFEASEGADVAPDVKKLFKED